MERFSPTNTVYELKAPTCADFEPNFQSAFAAVSTIDAPWLLSADGAKIAAIRQDHVYGLRKWTAHGHNSAHLPIIIKNPQRDAPSFGYRNGLTVFDDAAFAVRLTDGGSYITRPVRDVYQQCLC